MPNTTVLDNNGKVQLELDFEGDTALLRPVGIIDEDVNFSLVLQALSRMQPAIKSLQFDLGHVSRINSCGVREWVLLMERIPATVQRAFLNVNELFVEQANMVPGMFGRKGASILSFFAPFHCDQCNVSASVLLRPADITVNDTGPKAPALKCKTCSAPLEPDFLEEEYFGFITRL